MTRRLKLVWDKTTLALTLMAGVVVVEVIGYVVMMVVGVEVPEAYLSFMYTTLMGLAGVAGAQWVNGKTQT